MELDDDVFFADLSRQIALLITDDDEEERIPVRRPPTAPVQSYYHHGPQYMMPPQCAFEAAYRKESKGTGVFIPRSTCPRRKSRPSSGRYSSTSGPTAGHHRQRENTASATAISYGGGSAVLKRCQKEV